MACFTAVGSRRRPGPYSWRCPICSPNGVTATESGACYNGATTADCRTCNYKAKKKGCSRYGTNGKDGGRYAPWGPNSRPKPPDKPTPPSRRVPGSNPNPTPVSKEKAAMERKLEAQQNIVLKFE